ncbi:MAG TPA: peptidoglycan-binding domain-containing protein [Stellaceae bacterium]|nr:peptidoglycan-binding domain-containing protein [Stellaceae bacterium]
MIAGVATIALTLGGCGMFGGKSSSSPSATGQPSTNSTYSGTSSDNAAGAANNAAAPMSPSADHSATSSAPSASNGSSKRAGSADVREAQQQLQSAGFYKGKIDGIDGRQTRQALMSFQKKNGLPQTGKLDETTMAKLQSGSSSSGSGSSTPGASAPNNGSNPSGATTSPQQ